MNKQELTTHLAQIGDSYDRLAFTLGTIGISKYQVLGEQRKTEKAGISVVIDKTEQGPADLYCTLIERTTLRPRPDKVLQGLQNKLIDEGPDDTGRTPGADLVLPEDILEQIAQMGDSNGNCHVFLSYE